MADSSALLIPKDKLAGMKSWRPGSLAERAPGAERRAANQPASGTASATATVPAGSSPTPVVLGIEQSTELSVIEAAREALVEEATRFDAERTNARRAGFAEGFEVGYAEGKQRADEHAAKFEQLANALQLALTTFENDIAEQLTALSLDIARRVIRTDLTTDRDLLLPLIQETLRSVPEATAGGELRVHPDDLAVVRERLADELRIGNWLVCADSAVESGGCRVVTKQCEIDATLAARWRRVMQSLGRNDGWAAK
jgi:flagellar assembly protein FliH